MFLDHGLPLLGPRALQDLLAHLSQGGVVEVEGNVGILQATETVCLVVNIAVISAQQLG